MYVDGRIANHGRGTKEDGMKKILCIVVLVLALSFTAICEEDKNMVKLNIFERITLTNILPNRANFRDGLVIKDIRAKVKLSQEEMEKYEIKSEGGSITWNDPDYVKEIDITKLEIDILKSALNKMNEKKDIPTTDRFLALYEKIKGLE